MCRLFLALGLTACSGTTTLTTIGEAGVVTYAVEVAYRKSPPTTWEDALFVMDHEYVFFTGLTNEGAARLPDPSAVTHILVDEDGDFAGDITPEVLDESDLPQVPDFTLTPTTVGALRLEAWVDGARVDIAPLVSVSDHLSVSTEEGGVHW